MKLDTKKIDDIVWDGIEPEDYPDFANAHAIDFDYDGRDATDKEIEYFNANLIENYFDEIIQQSC